MSGAAIALYTCICFDSGPNTLSKVNVLEFDFSIVTCTSPFLVLHSMTEDDPAFFSEAFLGLMARTNFTAAFFSMIHYTCISLKLEYLFLAG